MNPIISGIQQVGIGIPDVHEAWGWYRRHFGFDVPVFEEAAEARLMLPYTGGQPQRRHAVLALNMRGGGGLEIWQNTGRVPQPPAFDIRLGDTGIFVVKIKAADVEAAYAFLAGKSGEALRSPIVRMPDGSRHFFVSDPYGNLFQVVKGNSWFSKNGHPHFGGSYGVVLGVRDMDRSLDFYEQVLGYDTILYRETGVFDDFRYLPGGDVAVERVLLKHSRKRRGPFSRLLGDSTIELVRKLSGDVRPIFQDRMWGDLGFIHLCFDVRNMDAVKAVCARHRAPFTVDSSGHFDMGDAAGRFAYVEDPDGTLIEFVETFKIPIVKKWGIFLNLQNRDASRPLPDWMLKALRYSRVKDENGVTAQRRITV